MIDESDVEDAGLFAALSPGLGGALLFIALALVLAYFASSNAEECGERKCERGRPKLMNHECLCVERAEP